jgi:segregation and condensation protein B
VSGGKRKPPSVVADARRRIEAAFTDEPPSEAAANQAEPVVDPLVRAVEAMLFAAPTPLSLEEIARRLPAGADAGRLIGQLRGLYAGRGIVVADVGGKWRMQTAPDLAYLFQENREALRKLPKAALETLAVVAYHQPVTRAEIEDIRGVSLSKGTLDFLIELGWVRPRGRRKTPGRPLTFGTTDAFLAQFGLPGLDSLPGKEDLKALGVLDSRAAKELDIPRPGDGPGPDEEPLQPGEDADGFYVDHMDAAGEETGGS